jgi:hypothetical protein
VSDWDDLSVNRPPPQYDTEAEFEAVRENLRKNPHLGAKVAGTLPELRSRKRCESLHEFASSVKWQGLGFVECD